MRVIATERGYFGVLREPGDVFDVPERSKATWFEPVKAEPKGKSKDTPSEDKPADDEPKGDKPLA